MRSEHLGSVLRRVLFASLASGSLLSAAGCGTAVGPADSATDSGADAATQDRVEPADVLPLMDTFNPTDSTDPPDVVEPSDGRVCPAVVSTNSATCEATVTWACNPPADVIVGQSVSPCSA